MAVLSRAQGYLAILAPRTGCTALSVHLIQEGTGEWFPAEDLTTEDGVSVPRKHTRLRELLRSGLLSEEERERLTVFTAVRNPYDSLVSLWSKYVGAYVPLLDDPEAFIHDQPRMVKDIEFCRDHSFAEWVEFRYGSKRDGTRRHLYGGYIDDVDRILRFESLQQDLDQLLSDLEAPPLPPIPVLNKTENRDDDYREHYDDRSRAIVRDVFAADLERFGYRF